ncbi:D-2-hydroxyacid dehydrogenase [Arcanobacterium ihumii]|uniref:D-2-hydroxyacid dehydrogenase n=1 Tax=Arcanobacterium ihumii TaxID=2138162 RepID=UPI00135A5C16|nr:D-2-hydroxyacid dehydrogenase [Arcanobacterium ihumii]
MTLYPKKVLLTEEYFAEFMPAATEEIGDIEFRFVPSDQLSDEDLNWADSWLGFQFPVKPSETSIRWYHSATDGIDRMHWLYDDLRETGSVLTNTVASMPHRMAEFVVAGVLGIVREFPQYRELQRRAEWKRLGNSTAINMNVVVIGTGHIGSEVARLLRPFVARVDGLSRSGRAKPAFDEVRALDSRGNLLSQADVVVAVLPHTPESKNIVNEQIFGELNDAIFVNIGRGTTVDDVALRHALEEGHLTHALLDVFDHEPLSSDDWHWMNPKVTVMPHISGLTRNDDIVADFMANLTALRNGEVPPNRIDLDSWY